MTQFIAKTARIFERIGLIFIGVARRLRRRFVEKGQQALTVAIVMPLTGPAANWLQSIKFDWLRLYGVSRGLEAAPHVTLKMGCKVRDLEAIAQYMAQIAAQNTAPLIKMQDVGRFDDGVMFLDVPTTEPLDTLRRRIVADLRNNFGIIPEELEGDTFHFHATIGFGLPPAACDVEYQRLRADDITFSEVPSAMELWVHVGANWAPYHHAQFKTQ
ncbi:MAG: 2'-5' RNA ligase family protein [Burkholderiales bacterium]|nr:2'-5' RNA ligase family protein [Burkholderiales bacterium]